MKFDISDMANNLEHMGERTDAAVRVFAEQGAMKLQNYAKSKAIWVDRTGDARRRLHGYVSALPNGYRITLAHGVDYGIWLELANEKRYAIIQQTIDHVGSFEIMPAFNRFLERLGH